MSYKIKKRLRSIIYAAVCLALCAILPYLTGSIPTIGKSLSPIHFPVFLCGFAAGPLWGGLVGALAPFLRFALSGAPAIYPQAVRMAAELLVYGLASGYFYRHLPKKYPGLLLSVLSAQFMGRLAWAAAQFIMSHFDEALPFYPELVITQTVVPSLYGILLQLVLIPPIVKALQKAKLISL